MLEQKPDKRPAVSDLLAHEQVQVRILEKKYKDKYAYLKKKEQEISKREKVLGDNNRGSSTSLTSLDTKDHELEEMDRIEQKLLAEIDRAERENQEIDQCIQ